MKIIITAGGTTEKIDDVRGITNFSTGRLGSLIADEFANDKIFEIIYIHGIGANLPVGANIRKIEIESTNDLAFVLKKIITTEKIDLLIHSMAISDYTGAGTTTPDILKSYLNNDTDKSINSFWHLFKLAKNTKISSDSDDLIVRLSKTPKIKEWPPETKLIGFKLLVDVSQQELISVANQTLVKNQCDYVLANDKKFIEGDNHLGLLLNKAGQITKFTTKQEIAAGLVEITKKEILS